MEDQHGGAGTVRPDAPRGASADAPPGAAPGPPVPSSGPAEPGAPAAPPPSPPGPPTEDPLPRPATVAVLAGMAVVFASFGAVFVLIADLQDEIGFPDWGLGLVVAASFGVSFVSQISLSPLADRGRALLLLRSGLVVTALGMVGVAAAGELWQLVLARAVVGLGGGTFLPAARRLVVMGAAGREAERLGRLESAALAGFIGGPPLAAVIASIGGLASPFLVLAGVLVAMVPMVAGVVEPGRVDTPRPAGMTSTLLRTPGVRGGLAIGAGVYLTIGVFDTLWARFLSDLGASTGFVAVSLLLFGLPMVVGTPMGGRLADRRGPRRTGFAALVCGLPLIVAYGQTTSLALLMVVAVLHSVVDSVTLPSGIGTVTRAAPAGLVAAGQGLYGATSAVAAGLSGALAAPLYGATTPAWTWTLTAVGVAALVAGGWWTSRNADAATG
jgi:MFS transporter, DHA1 family, multidrug resistance protein